MVGRSTIFYGALPVLVYIPRDASAPCATFTTKTSLSSLTANLVTAVDQWPQLADFPVVIGDILPSTTGVLDRISLSAAFHELRLALVQLRNVGIWCEAHSPCSLPHDSNELCSVRSATLEQGASRADLPVQVLGELCGSCHHHT